MASRPHILDYGIPTDKKGLLPWTHVSERMGRAKHYWICTVSPDGRPHATPVDGLWVDNRLYFGGSAKTRRNRNIKANSAVTIHLDSGTDVVILHGNADELRAPDDALISRLIEASERKYGYAPRPEDFAAGGTYVFQPQTVFAWKQFPNDATRWNFPTDG